MCSLGSFLLKFLHSSSLGYYLEQATRSIQLCGVIMEAIQGSHDSPLGKLITPCTLQGSFTSVHCDRYRKGHGRQIEEIQGEGYYSAQMDSKCWQLSSWAPHWMSNQKKKEEEEKKDCCGKGTSGLWWAGRKLPCQKSEKYTNLPVNTSEWRRLTFETLTFGTVSPDCQ